MADETDKRATSDATSPEPHEIPGGFSVGETVCVEGEAGQFQVRGVGPDGSLTVVGGPSKAFRSFLAEWCFPAKSLDRHGREVKGRLPSERRGLRDAWRAEHGHARVTVEAVSPTLSGLDDDDGD